MLSDNKNKRRRKKIPFTSKRDNSFVSSDQQQGGTVKLGYPTFFERILNISPQCKMIHFKYRCHILRYYFSMQICGLHDYMKSVEGSSPTTLKEETGLLEF